MNNAGKAIFVTRHPLRVAAFTLWVAVLAGCANEQRPAEQRSPLTYTITAIGAENSGLDADGTGERARRGAATGGLSGAGGGALIGLTCGPFAPFCVPAFAAAGLVVGGVGGSFHGLTGLNKGQAARTNAVLGPLDQRRDFARELEQALRGETPAGLQAEPGQSRARAEIHLQRFELVQHLHDEVSLTLFAKLDLRSERRAGYPAPRAKFPQEFLYRVESAQYPLESWLADGGRRFDEELTRCVTEAAERMRADLEEHARSETGPRDPRTLR